VSPHCKAGLSSRRSFHTPIGSFKTTGGCDPPGPPCHDPVMLSEAIRFLNPQPHEIIVDGTFGIGGYTRAILARGVKRLISIDRDPEACAIGCQLMAEHPALTMLHGTFGNLLEYLEDLGIEAIDGLVLDVGVSSMQLDTAMRGFSFTHDGPLDMRMSSSGPCASDIVNHASESELANIFYRFGEEHRSRAVARAIVKKRCSKKFTSTLELAKLAEEVIGKTTKKHPATRVFQALRIAVNDELGELTRVLEDAERIMNPGGRLVVVTFHSLEDRIVKTFFSQRSRPHHGSRHEPHLDRDPASFRLLYKGACRPSPEEVCRNPRARSAKLRAGIKL